MKSHHAQTSAGGQHISCVTQGALNDIQFLVHGNAQGLERPCRAVNATMAVDRRDGTRYRRNKIGGGTKWASISGGHNGTGNTTRIALFTIFVDKIGEFMLWKLGNQIRCSSATALIHAHIERTVGEKTHPPLRTVQLSRRHAKIKDHAVNLRYADRLQMLLERAEISLNQAHPRCEMR